MFSGTENARFFQGKRRALICGQPAGAERKLSRGKSGGARESGRPFSRGQALRGADAAGTRLAGWFCLQRGGLWLCWDVNDKEFFYRLLGLSEPWQVESVKLDLAGKRVEVRVAVKEGTK